MTRTAQPGDLLCTRGHGFGSLMIRVGAGLRDRPNLVNHVAVVHHTDPNGVCWVLEGRPGGVGWRQASDYLASRWTVINGRQPKTDAQRKTVTAGALALIGTSYDWEAIAGDAAQAFGLKGLWQPKFGTVPGHVVCSSLAAYLYTKAGLPCPQGGRQVTPADWLAFIISGGYGT